MAGYREIRSPELIAIDKLSELVGDVATEMRDLVKAQGIIVSILGQIKEAVTPQAGGGDDAFGKLLRELVTTSRAQIEGLARVERALRRESVEQP
jgi:hypothetical protein